MGQQKARVYVANHYIIIKMITRILLVRLYMAMTAIHHYYRVGTFLGPLFVEDLPGCAVLS